MNRYPYSYSTFPDVNAKAKRKSARNNTSVSTVIHEFLQNYVKDEPDVVDASGPNGEGTVTMPTIGNGPSEPGPADGLTIIAEKPEQEAANQVLASVEEPAPVEPEQEKKITPASPKGQPKKKATSQKSTQKKAVPKKAVGAARGKQRPSTNKGVGTTRLSKKGSQAKAQKKKTGRK